MRINLVVSATLLFAASLPWQATASSFNFTFAGPGVSGNVQITYGTASDGKYSQALEITGISGTFSDTNNGLGIVNTPILSPVPINHATPESTNALAPFDFSRFAVTTGLGPEANGFITYDNLYWPGGAPPTASDYQAQGGFVDIYGLAFNIGNYRIVDFWSNGTFVPGGPFTYGVAVATSATALDYVSSGVAITPEPGAFGLLGTGLLGLLAWRRRAAR